MSEKPLYCGFCGKSQHDVATLIAGPTVHICGECVALCDDVVKKRPLRPHTCVPTSHELHEVMNLARLGADLARHLGDHRASCESRR